MLLFHCTIESYFRSGHEDIETSDTSPCVFALYLYLWNVLIIYGLLSGLCPVRVHSNSSSCTCLVGCGQGQLARVLNSVNLNKKLVRSGSVPGECSFLLSQKRDQFIRLLY